MAEPPSDDAAKRAARADTKAAPEPRKTPSLPKEPRRGPARKPQQASDATEEATEEEQQEDTTDFWRLMVQGAYRSRKRRGDWTE
jgi:DNA-nicking Smr family endonuclease